MLVSDCLKCKDIVYKNQTALEVKDEQIKSRKVIGRIVFSAIIICFVVALIYQRWINKKNNQQALYRQALQYADEKQNVMQRRMKKMNPLLHCYRIGKPKS